MTLKNLIYSKKGPKITPVGKHALLLYSYLYPIILLHVGKIKRQKTMVSSYRLIIICHLKACISQTLTYI